MGANIFNSVKQSRPGKNSFDLTHDVKLSLDMGTLVPTLAMECVPGDKFHIGCESMLRLQPMLAPMMHRCDVTMHYFFVPNRLLWAGWEDFITNTKEIGVVPAPPTIDVREENYTRLLNYMGIPQPPAGLGEVETISALPLAAYTMIFNEFYRDQNLEPEAEFRLANGDNTSNPNLRTIRNRAWEHDYFTSALPFAQKGDPVVMPTHFNDVHVGVTGAPSTESNTLTGVNPDTGLPVSTTLEALPSQGLSGPPNNGLPFAQTSQLEGSTTINDLRIAIKLQEWLEKAARGGSRYVENILSHFGLRAQDSRLQRPEYITGTKSPIVVSEVLNTTGTDTSPQGTMAGHGVSITGGKSGGYFCQEHGYIIGIMSVLPKTAYFQGIPKHFLKFTDPTEYYWPSFANLGEQEIKDREIYAFQGDALGNHTFGYTPRYAEYKFMNNRICGDFQDSLDFWHMARKFDTPPALNSTFIRSNPTTRIFAVETGTDHLLAHVLHKIRAIRPMPKFGTPTF